MNVWWFFLFFRSQWLCRTHRAMIPRNWNLTLGIVVVPLFHRTTHEHKFSLCISISAIILAAITFPGWRVARWFPAFAWYFLVHGRKSENHNFCLFVCCVWCSHSIFFSLFCFPLLYFTLFAWNLCAVTRSDWDGFFSFVSQHTMTMIWQFVWHNPLMMLIQWRRLRRTKMAMACACQNRTASK